jgi:hypothetical protein
MQIQTVMELEWPKSRTLTTPNADENMEPLDSHSLLVRLENGTAILEDSLATSYKTKAYSNHMI